jgi:DNA-binding transcriptional LysR family regulator
VVRMGGYSTVLRSKILPAFKPLLSKNSDLGLKIFSREINELFKLLKNSEVDYIITNTDPQRDDLEILKLGEEQSVLVESKKNRSADFYLDHDENDATTLRYLKLAGLPSKKIRRRYLDDVYGLIDGVKLGLGRAILPLHLIEDDAELRILHPKTLLREPIYLVFYRQPYYTKLHEAVTASLISGF